jgi:hypothetical protein
MRARAFIGALHAAMKKAGEVLNLLGIWRGASFA